MKAKISLLLFLLTFLLCGCQNKNKIDPYTESYLTYANGGLYCLQGQTLYKHTKGRIWEQTDDLPYNSLFPDTNGICGLSAEGTIILPFDYEDVKAEFDNMDTNPGNGFAVFENAHRLYLYSKEEPLKSINASPMLLDNHNFLTLDGHAGVQDVEFISKIDSEEEFIEMSDAFYLSQSGNLYYYDYKLKKIYDNGDISHIFSGKRCCYAKKADGSYIKIRLTNKPETVSPIISDIKRIVVCPWFDLILKKDGTLICEDRNAQGKQNSQSEITSVLQEWEDIIDITEFSNTVYGLKKDGEVVTCQLNLQNE